MDDEINQLLKRSGDFADVLKTLSSTNDSLKFYLTKLKAKIGVCCATFGVTRKNPCVICYTRAVGIVNIPCGHLVCTACADRVHQRGKCFTCRAVVDSQHKVFM